MRSFLTRHPRLVAGLACALVLLVILRALLPFALRVAVNRRLAGLGDWRGSVAGIDLRLWRGSCRVSGLELKRGPGAAPSLLVTAEHVDFSADWGELVRGRVLGDLVLVAPRVRVSRAPAPPPPEKPPGPPWQDTVAGLPPVGLTGVEVRRGEFVFVDAVSGPRVELAVAAITATITGLRNRRVPPSEGPPVTLHLAAVAPGEGRLRAHALVDPLAAAPRFALNLDLEDVRLPDLNAALDAYLGVKVDAGVLRLYLEIEAGGGDFAGYAKPFLENVKFSREPERSLGERVRAAVADGLAAVLENEERRQIATRVPFSGRFGSADAGLWAALETLLRNSFVEALERGRDDSVPSASGETPKIP